MTLPEAGFNAHKPDSVVGIYRLVRRIGEGGMSTVWLAFRTDELVHRPVALKLPHVDLQHGRFADRFARERDLLANLTHPNIAHLYDAGISPQGQPFLAMEFVEGEPLTQYCESHSLGIDDRLELFLQVLAAVAYAHRQGVIHRDLKPSNILVREAGQVALLDFGIAKLLVEGTAAGTELTQQAGAAWTPEYASPEQIKGEPLGPSTDVYSLGVVLYELLSGQRPYARTRSTRRDLEDAILSADPPRPSEVPSVAAAAFRKALRRDIDGIVLKALHKQPVHRYPTADALADDLRRYLRHEAVCASPDAFGDRLRTLLSRHRPTPKGAATAGALVLALAVAAAGVTHLLAHRAALSALIAAKAPNFPGAIPASLPERSVAVLPFVDMSEKKDQEYFSDGLSEELIDMLAKVPDLRVPARTSSFYFKGKQTKVADIARELGVAHVLEGSVRKSGDRLRITAQLIRVDNGYHLWSQTYDRKVGDIFQIQDDIATAVVSSLGPKLGVASPHAAPGDGVVVEAYDEWLLARSLFSRPQPGSFRRGIAALEEAIRLDPNFAPAYSALAFARCNAAAARGRSDIIAESQALLDKALALSPDLADAFAARSQCRLYSLDFPGSLADARRAVAGAPGDARFQIGLAYALAGNGNFDQAIAAAKVGTALDPLNIYGWMALGEFLTVTHEWPDARRALERALQIGPGEPEGVFALGALDLLEGHAEKALATFENSTWELHRKVGAALADYSLGRDRESREALAELIAEHKDTAAYQISSCSAS